MRQVIKDIWLGFRVVVLDPLLGFLPYGIVLGLYAAAIVYLWYITIPLTIVFWFWVTGATRREENEKELERNKRGSRENL